jgi:competence protein ComEC
MSFSKIEILGKAGGDPMSAIFSGILSFKAKLRKSIEQNFLPPYSSILKGTILGDNGAMSADFKAKLNITGLRHIIAVSGTHIIILSQILIYCLLALGFWRKQAIVSSIIIVWVYIFLTGLAPSGIRAGIMGTLLFLSQVFGRQNTSQRTITLAGALMLLQNPLLLIFDAGFQLSFLASLGIIYLNPIFGKIFPAIISTTFSAQIFTLPLMAFNFGNISLVAPITNLLIAPIIEPLMIFGFVSVFLGVFSNLLGFILSFPCQILLMYFNSIIELFSKPYMAIFFENKSWIWLIISYPIIFGFTWFLNKKYSQKF